MGISSGDAGGPARNYVKWGNGRLKCTRGESFGLTTASFLGKEDDMTTRQHQVIKKILVGGAVALGLYVGGAAPASADPNSIGGAPNPFGGLSCSCRQTAPLGSPTSREEIERGLREGLSAELSGPPPSTQPGQPQ
jgi:hypothetical protein